MDLLNFSATGMPICALHAAAAAGAVYGTISSFPQVIGSCVRFCGMLVLLSEDDIEAARPLL
jgi:hypothetical protein